MMISEDKIKEWLEEVESDTRLNYPPADVRINAPLAIEQITLKERSRTLRRVLGLPLKDFPRKDV